MTVFAADLLEKFSENRQTDVNAQIQYPFGSMKDNQSVATTAGQRICAVDEAELNLTDLAFYRRQKPRFPIYSDK
jgi:hypothetical protein